MSKVLNHCFLIGLLFSIALPAAAMDSCKPLVRQIKVFKGHAQCNGAPAVRLRGAWRNSFSAAFRWDDGSASGQDRHPNFLDDSSAQSSPYKAQRRVRNRRADFLCYKRGLRLRRLPRAEQLTIKRTTAPVVDRFCVKADTFRKVR